jgi:capsular exopolysaccharide synthesis family protein
MRKPRLDKIFDVESHKGVSTILSGQTKIDDCIMESGIPNLDFITSGPVPPNPSELILLPKLGELLAYLKTKYDYVIIDTPPIGLVTDALEILKVSDYPIYILRAAYSNRSFIHSVNRTINESKIKNLSVVINDFGRGASGYGYGYGNTYGYNYGYGYGYGYGYYGSKYGEGYYTTESRKKPKSWLTRLLGEKK